MHFANKTLLSLTLSLLACSQTPTAAKPAPSSGQQAGGQPTASGEPYDMYDMTAAHLKLPLGSYVRVTNLRNGRAVVVRVNDRGPIIPGRIIDLSYGAAAVLGYDKQGLQRVRLDVVKPPRQKPTYETVAYNRSIVEVR